MGVSSRTSTAKIGPRHGSAAPRRNRLRPRWRPPWNARPHANVARVLTPARPPPFLPSALSWPIASWTEDYKRNQHATADRHIEGGPQMTRSSPTNSVRVTRRSFAAGARAAGLLAASAPRVLARAQGRPFKVGVLLPLSGAQASIGQDCYRGVEVAPGIFQALGLPELAIMKADTETNVEVARARAEKLINDGAQLLVGAFDSGQTTAIAQVAEQKGIPFGNKHRRRSADHRAGLQVCVPQFPDCADDPQRRLRQPEGSVRGRRVRPEESRLPPCERHVRHLDGEEPPRLAAQVRHAVPDRGGDRLRSDRARPLSRGGQSQGDRCRGAAGDQPAQRRDPDYARADQAALDSNGRAEHGTGMVRGPIPEDPGQAVRRAAQLRAVVRPEQEAEQAA